MSDIPKQKINLLRHLKERRSFCPKVPFTAARLIVIIFLLCCAIIVGLLLTAGYMKKQELASLQDKYQKDMIAINQASHAIEKERGKFLGRLPLSFKLRNVGFYNLLYDLSSYSIEKVWLTNIYYDYESNILRFTGAANNAESIQEFVHNIGTNSAVSHLGFALFFVDDVNRSKKLSVKGDADINKENVEYLEIDGVMHRRVTSRGIVATVRLSEEQTRKLLGSNENAKQYNKLMDSTYSRLMSGLKKDKDAPFVFILQNKLTEKGLLQ